MFLSATMRVLRSISRMRSMSSSGYRCGRMDMISAMSTVFAASVMAGLSISCRLLVVSYRRSSIAPESGNGQPKKLLLLEQHRGIELGGIDRLVVRHLGDEALADHIAVLIAGDGHGRRQALN